MFSTVARLYVEAKARKRAGNDHGMGAVGQEFDAYLSALGLAPGNVMAQNAWGGLTPDGSSSMTFSLTDSSLPTPGFGGSGMDLSSMAGISQATQLGNWFSSNQYMMGLLEEDLFQFNPS